MMLRSLELRLNTISKLFIKVFYLMKKIIVTIFLTLSLFLTSYETSFAAKKGKGEVKLSQGSLKHFIRYIQGKIQGGVRWTPMMFILSSDGKWSSYWYCPYANCRDARSEESIAKCEQETNVKCGVFAMRRKIYWDNGQVGKKKPTMNSKWSDAKFKEELTKLGFLDSN